MVTLALVTVSSINFYLAFLIILFFVDELL